MEHANLGIGLGIDSCSIRILPEFPKEPKLSLVRKSLFLLVKGMNEGSQPP